jgi:hypothetical protein
LGGPAPAKSAQVSEVLLTDTSHRRHVVKAELIRNVPGYHDIGDGDGVALSRIAATPRVKYKRLEADITFDLDTYFDTA